MNMPKQAADQDNSLAEIKQTADQIVQMAQQEARLIIGNAKDYAQILLLAAYNTVRLEYEL